MKKLIYFLIISFSLFEACSYPEGKYDLIREFDGGTYLTDRGIAKYISGKKDTAIQIGDIYAVVKQQLTYTDDTKDTIMYFGHCWGEKENPRVIDTMSTKFDNPDTLKAGISFESSMPNLKAETEYFVRSYVITKKGSTTDTAYNPQQFSLTTLNPRDIWESRNNFEGAVAKGAISFSYKGKLYAGLGENEFQKEKDIYEYNPEKNTWTKITTYPGGRVSNAVCFIIEHVLFSQNVYKDYLYVGLGNADNIGKFTKEFWRLDLTATDWTTGWERLNGLSEYSGFARENAVAFVIYNSEKKTKIAYVGLGVGNSGSVLGDFFRIDPEFTDDGAGNTYPQGRWEPAASLPVGARERTGAVAFTIGESGFVCSGENANGVLLNDLWMYRESSNEAGGNWVQRAPFPGTARTEAAGFALGENGYLGTGWDGDSLRSDFWRYVPYTNTWDERAVFAPGEAEGAEPRMGAIGIGLKYGENDYRGYIGMGGGKKGEAVYYSSLWQYRQ